MVLVFILQGQLELLPKETQVSATIKHARRQFNAIQWFCVLKCCMVAFRQCADRLMEAQQHVGMAALYDDPEYPTRMITPEEIRCAAYV
jgi:hypothetical protein